MQFLTEPLAFFEREALKFFVALFETLPLLATPPLLWTEAAELGQACRQKNITVNSLDLLIAAIALHHGAEVVTFDDDFQKIASVSKLLVKLLKRPTP